MSGNNVNITRRICNSAQFALHLRGPDFTGCTQCLQLGLGEGKAWLPRPPLPNRRHHHPRPRRPWVEFFAAPSDGAPWPYETPYAPDGKMGRALQKYGPKLRHEVSLHRRKGNFALTLSRHIIKNPKRANLNPADAADNWRTQRTIRAPEPRRPAVASSAIHPQPPTPAPPVINASNASRGYRFLLNPADQPPAKVEDLLPKLGRATNGDRVYVVDPRDEDAPRIDTPGLPSRLVETLPPMASVVPRVPATTLAQQPVHPAITHPTSPVPQAVAVEVEFPAPLSSIDEEDMDVSDEDGDGDDSAMEDVAATPSPLPIPAVKEISPRNDHRERVNYDARKFFHEHPDEPSKTALVFGAFLTPTPTTPVVSTSRARAMGGISEEEKKQALAARSAFAASTAGDVLVANVMRTLSPLTPIPHLRRLGSGGDDAPVEQPTAPASTRNAAADESDDEEGEIHCAPSSTPRVSHAELVPVPVLGSGKRGPLVTRERYSSSPSFQSATSGDFESEGKLPSGWEKICSPEHVADITQRPNQATRNWLDREYDEVSDKLERQLMISPADNSQTSEESDEEGDEERSSSMPPLMSVSDSEEDELAESYVFGSVRADVNINDSHSRINSDSGSIALPLDQLEQELAHEIGLIHLAPPAFAIAEGAHARAAEETRIWASNLDAATLTRNVEQEVFVAQPLHEFVQTVLAHPDLLLDHDAMNTGPGIVEIEDFYRKMRTFRDQCSNTAQLGWVCSLLPSSSSAEFRDTQNLFTPSEINSIAIPRHDGMQRLCDSQTVPRRSDGVPFRKIGGYGATQSLIYKGGLSILASRHPELIACHTLLLSCLDDYTNRGADMIRQRGWRYNMTGITGPANVPFPFADEGLNLRFRVVNATMAHNGRATLAELGDCIMKLRFRNPEMVSHWLHSDMLRATDVDETVTNEEMGALPNGIQARFNFTYPLPKANSPPFQTERCDDSTRVLGNWAALPTSPAPAQFTNASGYMGIRHSTTPGPSHRRVTSIGVTLSRSHTADSRSPTPEPVHPGYHLVDSFVRWTPPVAKTVPSTSSTRTSRRARSRGNANTDPQ
ncbi:hypothetical protein C8R47DRAFT_1065012 [Mycena vitilis]|nr:hypothetical protein C8R47DRAFT_1065012 [Mycena vitilis]